MSRQPTSGADRHGARGTFPGKYLMFAVGIAPEPQAAEAIEAHAARLVDALAEYHSPSGYFNFAEQVGTDPASLYDDESYARLRAVKAAYDPTDRFRGNHRIPAAG